MLLENWIPSGSDFIVGDTLSSHVSKSYQIIPYNTYKKDYRALFSFYNS